MLITILKAKLHMARVTEAVFEYEGSLGIDEELMEAVGIIPYEKILISNMENTNRFETYAIPAKRGSGTISLNGPAAHLGSVGDKLVVFAFAHMTEEEVRKHKPHIAVLDENNHIIKRIE
jgi:aspartate 1-decarboxylase